jgi:hypothetical protein
MAFDFILKPFLVSMHDELREIFPFVAFCIFLSTAVLRRVGIPCLIIQGHGKV